jgi:hypothetical protein
MLTQENIDKLRTLLIQAIDNHLANGGKIVSGRFSTGFNEECCPVTCLVGDEGLISRTDRIATKLGVPFSGYDMWALIDGFDQRRLREPYKNSELYKLGQELRAKYLPVVNP